MTGSEKKSGTDTPEAAVFWEATKNGQLLIGQCRHCKKAHYYPRPICPFCSSEDVAHAPASGKAVIYSYSVITAPEVRVVAYVTLEEGPTILTNIISSDPDALTIGQAVTLTFKSNEDGSKIPAFMR